MASAGNTLLALITGAAIGAGLGILYAPESGEETRKKLKSDAQTAQDRLNQRYKETTSNLSDKAKRARADFETRLEETLSSASHKADDILASMESKLDELRKQNSKLQKDKPVTTTGNSNSKGNTPDKAVV